MADYPQPRVRGRGRGIINKQIDGAAGRAGAGRRSAGQLWPPCQQQLTSRRQHSPGSSSRQHGEINNIDYFYLNPRPRSASEETLAPRPVCCLAVVVRLLWCKNVVVAWPRPGAGKSVVRLCLVPAGAARCAQLSFNDETLPSAADVDPAPAPAPHPAPGRQRLCKELYLGPGWWRRWCDLL